MGPPHEWEVHSDDPSHEFLLDICFNKLKDVVQKVINESKNVENSAVEVFKGLRHLRVKGEDRPRFERHLILAEHFEKSLMRRFWIRNRTNDEREKNSGEDFGLNNPISYSAQELGNVRFFSFISYLILIQYCFQVPLAVMG